MDYIINSVKMGGLIKSVDDNRVKIHLYGRLGVIHVSKSIIHTYEELEAGQCVEFYFSYMEAIEKPFDYDATDIRASNKIAPSLLGGKIIEINDTAVVVDIMDEIGTINVPRRWVITPIELKKGLDIEFYFSGMRVIGKKDLPIESI
ncbi:MAG TPA: hypothetical protein GX736_04965 [Mogibacterium sp.]|nr:hypothetical protein [Mogibacterium sp.]